MPSDAAVQSGVANGSPPAAGARRREQAASRSRRPRCLPRARAPATAPASLVLATAVCVSRTVRATVGPGVMLSGPGRPRSSTPWNVQLLAFFSHRFIRRRIVVPCRVVRVSAASLSCRMIHSPRPSRVTVTGGRYPASAVFSVPYGSVTWQKTSVQVVHTRQLPEPTLRRRALAAASSTHTSMLCTRSADRPAAPVSGWEPSGTSSPINRHECETAERSFAQVSSSQPLAMAGHRIHWSLPGHLISRTQYVCTRRPVDAGHLDMA